MSDIPSAPQDTPEALPDTLPASIDAASHLPAPPATAAEIKQATQYLVTTGLLPSVVLTTTETAKEAEKAIVDPKSSQQSKLTAANEMSALGINQFKDSSGHQYDISTNTTNGSTHVEITATSGNGKPQVVAVGQTDSTQSEVGSPGAPSAQQQQLLDTMRSHGEDPGTPTEADRLAMLKQTAQLTSTLDSQAVQKEVAAERLQAQEKSLNAADIDADNAGWGAGDKLNQDLKAVGLHPMNTDSVDPQQLATAQQAVKGATNLSDAQRAQLQQDFQSFVGLSDAAAKADQQDTDAQDAIRTAGIGVHHAADALYSQDQRLLATDFRADLQAVDRLPEQQRSGVYNSFERIATDNGNDPNHLNAGQRQQIIEQLAHQIAHPESIKQGTKSDCAGGSTEFLLASDSPDKYASVVADLATTGKTTLNDGVQMRIDSTEISIPQADGSYAPASDGNPDRSLASKIFQTAEIGASLQYRAIREGTAPSLYVDSTSTGSPDIPAFEDTGEYEVAADGSVHPFTGTYAQDDVKVLSGLSGHTYKAVDITTQPGKEAQAQQRFLDLASHNGLPMRVDILVHPGDFTGLIGQDESREGGHAVVITRVETGPSPSVYFYNSEGGTDHNYPSGTPVPLSEFLQSTHKDPELPTWVPTAMVQSN